MEFPTQQTDAGLELSPEFHLWNGTEFVTPTNPLSGLDQFVPDVFVIWRPLATGFKSKPGILQHL